MMMPGRHASSDSYLYGFQGQEMDDEVKGEENSVNYKYRMHDPRLGRFFSVDPLAAKYPHYTPYSFSGNKVIHKVELEGLEEGELKIGVGMTFGSDNRRITGSLSGSLSGSFSISKDFKLFNQSSGVGMTFSGTASGSINIGSNFSLNYTHNTTKYTGHFSSLSNSTSRLGVEVGNESFNLSGGWTNDNALLKFGLGGSDKGFTHGIDYGVGVDEFSLGYSSKMLTDSPDGTTPENPENGENGTYKTPGLKNSFHHYQMLNFSYSGNSTKLSLSTGFDNFKAGQKVQNHAHQGATNLPGDKLFIFPFNGAGVSLFNWSAQPGYADKRSVWEGSFSASGNL
jgi:RHS repeat-associated protein